MDDLEKAAEDRLDNRTLMTLIEAVRRQGKSDPDQWDLGASDFPLTWALIRFSIAALLIWDFTLGDQAKIDQIADFALTYTGE